MWVWVHNVSDPCSKVTYENIVGALTINVTQLTYSRIQCPSDCQSHALLLPFFHDNVSLCQMYKELKMHTSLEELKTLIDQCKVDAEFAAVPDTFMTGGPLNQKGTTFLEDVWSTRLSGCLREFLPDHLKKSVHCTCAFGRGFTTRQAKYTTLPADLALCYPFHGSPDITINNTAIVCSDTGEVESDPEELDSIIENALQSFKQCTFPPKIGELLANMHVIVCKKILRSFLVRRYDREEFNYVCSGLLLQKTIGRIMCRVKVPLKKNGITKLEVEVDDFSCHTLTPRSLCHLIAQLLQESLHKEGNNE